MSLLLASALAASVATTPACSWDRPGVNPYTGGLAEAVDGYADIPPATRARLRQRVAARQYDDLATISRDAINGRRSYLPEMRDMHFGSGKVCATVTRSRWPQGALERGLVYCEAEHCVIVPTVCRNVSRVTRLPARPAVALGAEGLRQPAAAPRPGEHVAAGAPAEDVPSAGTAPPPVGFAPAWGLASLSEPVTAPSAVLPAAPVQPAPLLPPQALAPGVDGSAPDMGDGPPLAPPPPTSGASSVPLPISPWTGATGGGGMFLPGGGATPPIPEPGRAWTLLAGGGVLGWMLARRRRDPPR